MARKHDKFSYKCDKYTLTRKSHNIYGIDSWYFSQGSLLNKYNTEEIIYA